jgi:hypothetical protein
MNYRGMRNTDSLFYLLTSVMSQGKVSFIKSNKGTERWDHNNICKHRVAIPIVVLVQVSLPGRHTYNSWMPYQLQRLHA